MDIETRRETGRHDRGHERVRKSSDTLAKTEGNHHNQPYLGDRNADVWVPAPVASLRQGPVSPFTNRLPKPPPN